MRTQAWCARCWGALARRRVRDRALIPRGLAMTRGARLLAVACSGELGARELPNDFSYGSFKEYMVFPTARARGLQKDSHGAPAMPPSWRCVQQHQQAEATLHNRSDRRRVAMSIHNFSRHWYG